MTSLAATRAAVAAALVTLAVVLQVSVLPSFAWDGPASPVPNLLLLVVVAAALTRGGQFAMVLGFAGGVVLDLAPPADHLAGRWALALLVVGYVAGRLRQDHAASRWNRPSAPPALAVVGTVAGCSFVGTSLYALTGVLLRDPAVGVGEMLPAIAAGVLWDVLLTPLVVPALMMLWRRAEPDFAR